MLRESSSKSKKNKMDNKEPLKGSQKYKSPLNSYKSANH